MSRKLAELMKCYARGTDAIGDTVANPTKEEAIAAGLAIYNTGFDSDAVFYVWFPGSPFSSQVDPDPELLPPTVAPVRTTAGWARFVADAFRGNQPERQPSDFVYNFTQHITDVVSTRTGGPGARPRDDHGESESDTARRAEVVAYLHATHVRTGENVDVANGTYTLHAQKDARGQWKVKQLKLTLLNFVPYWEAKEP